MTTIPKNQREKHPELYPLPKEKEQYINHIYEMCDNANSLHKKRKLSQIRNNPILESPKSRRK